MIDQLVYDFDEHCEGGRELLGGKGLGLAEMTALGLPVPAGFTVTTEACRRQLAHGGPLPLELHAEIERHLATLERRTGKRFGDPSDPLLVSVRSGGPVSMPGMMETVLKQRRSLFRFGIRSSPARGLRCTLIPSGDGGATVWADPPKGAVVHGVMDTWEWF